MTSRLIIVFSMAITTLLPLSHAEADRNRGSSCYKGNEFVILPGAFTASSAGEGRVQNGEITLGGVTGPEIPAKVEWETTVGVGTNSMSGRLNMHIELADGTEIEFVSRCIAEAQLDTTGQQEDLEAEFEGTVKNFPGRGKTAKAVGTIGVSRDPVEGLTFHVSVELGTTCNEGVQATSTDNEIGAGGNLETGNLQQQQQQQQQHAGRAGFPRGFSPSNCPDFQ